jgi:hypothetical protein
MWDRIEVPVAALDACVFDARGMALLNTTAPAPDNLQPGWQLRYKGLIEWASSVLDRYDKLNPNGQVSESHLKKLLVAAAAGVSELTPIQAALDGKRVSFGLRRIGRVSGADVRLMLTRAGNYSARPPDDGPLFLDEPSAG